MTYKPYTIVVVPFPFTDKAQTKKRPAIVLSSLLHQEESQHITLLMITSAKNSGWKSDYLLRDLKETGLSVSSIVRQKIFTIDSRLVLRSIGCLSAHDKSAVIKALQKNLVCK